MASHNQVRLLFIVIVTLLLGFSASIQPKLYQVILNETTTFHAVGYSLLLAVVFTIGLALSWVQTAALIVVVEDRSYRTLCDRYDIIVAMLTLCIAYISSVLASVVSVYAYPFKFAAAVGFSAFATLSTWLYLKATCTEK